MLSCKVNEQQKALQLVIHSVNNITFSEINKLQPSFIDKLKCFQNTYTF